MSTRRPRSHRRAGTAAARRRRRRRGPRCVCGTQLRRYWSFCPTCRKPRVWPDVKELTGAECYLCGWVVSNRFSFCPWCKTEIYEEGVSSETPLKAPTGFKIDARCDAGCGGGVQYPMRCCPWCGRDQHWNEDHLFEGDCPHCGRGVDDNMEWCP